MKPVKTQILKHPPSYNSLAQESILPYLKKISYMNLVNFGRKME